MPLRNATSEVYPVTLSIGKFLITDSDAATTVLSVAKQSSLKPVVVYDSANRADGAIGNADTGQAWTVLGGTWVVSSNTIKKSAAGSAQNDVVVIDSGVYNAEASLKIAAGDPYVAVGRIWLRVSDIDNAIVFASSAVAPGYYKLFRKQSGSFTQLAQVEQKPLVNDVMKVRFVGNSIIAYINGVEVMNVTESFNNTATSHGICLADDNLSVDDFLVEAI